MIDILITTIFMIILIICFCYVLVENIRRKNQESDKTLEANIDIRLSLVAISIGIVFYIIFTIVFYINSMRELESLITGYGIAMIFVLISYFSSRLKVVITKSNGAIVSYGLLKKKNFNVFNITLIKHSYISWKAYAQNKRLFYMSGTYYKYSNEFYIFILEKSKCHEIYPKGY
jgi:heme/copper-type cytochrome/quinol oxidase subunit 2